MTVRDAFGMAAAWVVGRHVVVDASRYGSASRAGVVSDQAAGVVALAGAPAGEPRTHAASDVLYVCDTAAEAEAARAARARFDAACAELRLGLGREIAAINQAGPDREGP
jgi:phosphoglycolate phosphatase-like HAD superfamily hydrolase